MAHVSNEDFGRLARYWNDVQARVLNGQCDPDEIMNALHPVVHGRSRGLDLFTSPERQLRLAREWTGTFPLDDMLFERAKKNIPLREGLGPLEAIVLDIQLESPQDTFSFALNMARVRTKMELPICLKSLDLEVLDDRIEIKPRSLKWRVTDLGAFYQGNETVQSVCDDVHPDRLPHSAVPWCLAFFPKWVQAIGTTVRGVSVPGVQIAGYRHRGEVLTIERDSMSRISLRCLRPDEPYGLAIPVFSALKYPAAS